MFLKNVSNNYPRVTGPTTFVETFIMLVSPILLYHSISLVLFGAIGLMCFPLQMLRASGFKAPMEERQLMIYRICGLWVATSGVISAIVWYSGDEQIQRRACVLFALVHAIETVIKMRAIPGSVSQLIANGHLVVLLGIAALI